MHMALLTWVVWVTNSVIYTGVAGYILKDPRMYCGDLCFQPERGKKSLVTFRISDTFIP